MRDGYRQLIVNLQEVVFQSDLESDLVLARNRSIVFALFRCRGCNRLRVLCSLSLIFMKERS